MISNASPAQRDHLSAADDVDLFTGQCRQNFRHSALSLNYLLPACCKKP
jgi:hypothetical protein